MVWVVNMNLEHMVLIKVATQLWKHIHTSNDFQENFQISVAKWDILEDICLANIENLHLPDALIEKIKKLIKPIGLEIVKFNHNRIGILPGNDCIQQKPINLFWTTQGTVDTKRTYKALIDDQSIDLAFRYRLACHSCLEHDISVLWDQMSEEQQYGFSPIQKSHLTSIWYKLSRNRKSIGVFACKNDFSEFYEYAISQSLKEHNKDAVEFFWKKLTAEKRSLVLPKVLKKIEFPKDPFEEHGRNSFHHVSDCNEVVLFLLKQVYEEPLLADIMPCPTDDRLLNGLLDWPCQEHFLEMLDSFQLSVFNHHYTSILKYVADKVYFGFQDYDYGQLLKALLKQESQFQKQCDRPIFPSSFDIFRYFHFRDSAAISLIVSYCKSALKKDVISSQDIFENLSDEEEWEFLTFIFCECILKSKQETFLSGCNGPFRRINYENFKNREERQSIHDFLNALALEKIEVLKRKLTHALMNIDRTLKTRQV